MGNALEDFERSMADGGRKVTKLRYVDDIFIIPGSLDKLQNRVNRGKLESEIARLFFNIERKQK